MSPKRGFAAVVVAAAAAASLNAANPPPLPAPRPALPGVLALPNPLAAKGLS